MPKDRYAFQLAIFVVLGVLAIDLFSHLWCITQSKLSVGVYENCGSLCISNQKYPARYNQYVLLHLMCSFKPKSQISAAVEDCKIHSRYTSLVLRKHSYKGVLHMLGNANRYLEPPCGVFQSGKLPSAALMYSWGIKEACSQFGSIWNMSAWSGSSLNVKRR